MDIYIRVSIYSIAVVAFLTPFTAAQCLLNIHHSLHCCSVSVEHSSLPSLLLSVLCVSKREGHYDILVYSCNIPTSFYTPVMLIMTDCGRRICFTFHSPAVESKNVTTAGDEFGSPPAIVQLLKSKNKLGCGRRTWFSRWFSCRKQ